MSSPLTRLAELAVAVGANVQPGQIVVVQSGLEGRPLVREVARVAYERGARFVDAVYFDADVKRVRVESAPEETLDFVPPWYGERLLAWGEHRCARIVLAPVVPPGLLDGVDPRRAGRDPLPFLKETLRVVNERTTNWTILPSPTVTWAKQVYPELEPEAALERLWEQVLHVCRLDEEDPEAAWEERVATLDAVSSRLTARRFDALHFDGPGTDLTVGLLPRSVWDSAYSTTVEGIRHLVNIPSEETFTAPDPERVDGVVRSTQPLEVTGTIVRGLRIRFEGGRAVEIDADANADVMRGRCAADEGAARLGEVALVDREGRIGPLGTSFYTTLLDENAASHLAFGDAYDTSAEESDRPRLNRSDVHIDFMVGSEDVAVTGVTSAGERVPVLRGGSWQL